MRIIPSFTFALACQVSGCGAQGPACDAPSYRCNEITVAELSPSSGSRITSEGASFVPFAPTAASGTCRSGAPAIDTKGTGDLGVERSLTILCRGSEAPSLDIQIPLGDLRTTSNGKTQAPFSGSPTPLEASVEVEITNAVGGAAPFPELVTADFRRDIAIHIHSVTGSPTNLDAVLYLTTSAADYFGQGTMCRDCSGPQ